MMAAQATASGSLSAGETKHEISLARARTP
jgi:hypothetical protein